MTNLIAILFSLLVFGIYVDRVWKKYGIQKSISMSYYCLPENRRWIFTLVLAGFTVPLVIASSDMILMPIAAGLVGLVGSACNFIRSRFTKWMHMFGAFGGILLGYYSIWTEYHMWYLVLTAALLSVLATILDKDHKIWWIEIISFAVLCFGILINFII